MELRELAIVARSPLVLARVAHRSSVCSLDDDSVPWRLLAFIPCAVGSCASRCSPHRSPWMRTNRAGNSAASVRSATVGDACTPAQQLRGGVREE